MTFGLTYLSIHVVGHWEDTVVVRPNVMYHSLEISHLETSSCLAGIRFLFPPSVKVQPHFPVLIAPLLKANRETSVLYEALFYLS